MLQNATRGAFCNAFDLQISANKNSKTCVKRPLSRRQKIGFQDQLSRNAGQKCCRKLPLEHSAMLLTFIKLPVVFKIFVLSLFEWPFYTGFTVTTNFRVYLFHHIVDVLA